MRETGRVSSPKKYARLVDIGWAVTSTREMIEAACASKKKCAPTYMGRWNFAALWYYLRSVRDDDAALSVVEARI